MTQTKGEVHLFRTTSEGQIHDHAGKWKDETTLELKWHGTFEDQEQEKHITRQMGNQRPD